MKHAGIKLKVESKPSRLWPRLVDTDSAADTAEVNEFYQNFRPTIPLDRALLCLDCDSLFLAEGTQRCPSCGSQESWAIGRALNRAAVKA